MYFNQYIEGKKLVLEPVEDVDALAGSLNTGKRAISIRAMKAAARAAIAEAGMAGIRVKH
jgi:hypothetical protein